MWDVEEHMSYFYSILKTSLSLRAASLKSNFALNCRLLFCKNKVGPIWTFSWFKGYDTIDHLK